MSTSNPNSILASYATYKELYSNGNYKSPYFILADFIKSSIVLRNLHTFCNVDMKSYLQQDYGFDLPVAVVESALKKVDYVTKRSGFYSVQLANDVDNHKFQECNNKSVEAKEYLSSKLHEFVQINFPQNTLSKNALEQDLIAFLADEECHNPAIISEFILKSNSDQRLLYILDSIREGSILYMGLNYNIAETGSILHPMTLYLDMEILFDICGLNGYLYESLSHDMIRLIRDANRGKKMIQLKYFAETKREIEHFFGTAELIVSGSIMTAPKPAMVAIVNGCLDRSDVAAKQADFFHRLQYEFGIVQDDFGDYYSDELMKYNIEGTHIREEIEDSEYNESLMLISHVNIHRKGQLFTDYAQCRCLLITETSRTIDLARKLIECEVENESCDSRSYVSYAFRMGNITNYLWYKLNKGFGNKEFPLNTSTIMKAKMVLSNVISQNVVREYEKAKKERESGTLDDESFNSRILVLREKCLKPEDLTSDNYDDVKNFSIERLDAFIYENEQNRSKIAELEKLLEREKTDSNAKLNAQQAALVDAGIQISEKDALIHELQSYKDSAEEKAIRKSEKLSKLKTVFKITVVVIALILVTYLIANYISSEYSGAISLVVGFVSLIISIGVEKKKQ